MSKLPHYFLDLSVVKPGETVVRDGIWWLYFTHPNSIVRAFDATGVTRGLEEIEQHINAGGWVCGFVSFEAAAAVNSDIVSKPDGRPLLWFGLYNSPPTRYRELLPCYEARPIKLAPVDLDFALYSTKFQLVKDALRRGEAYQVNLTMRQRFCLQGSAAEFFTARCGVSPPPYATYINGGDWVVASFSPELFFERIGDDIVSKPMKGTVARPKDRNAERAAAKAMSADPKSIAENIMIVDMVRNDLGSIAQTGSVSAPALLQVERHRDLLQMTSTITATTSAPTMELFRHLFPPASVTGAPKISACQLIAKLEESPRGIYCGGIGYMSPGKQRFNVAIRTAWIDTHGNGEFGMGSGLVWDSDAKEEYAECLAKRDFLLNAGTQWALIEALPGHELANLALVERHLSRLSKSAEDFGIQFDIAELRTQIRQLKETKPGDRVKVRIELRKDGTFSIETASSSVATKVPTATLAKAEVNSCDPNVRYKTTSRDVYQAQLDANPDFDEVLLFNELGELTEFCRGNVVVVIDGKGLTPDPSVGCLPGIGIANLIESGAGNNRFAHPTVSQLAESEAVYFVNSVVGMIKVDFDQ